MKSLKSSFFLGLFLLSFSQKAQAEWLCTPEICGTFAEKTQRTLHKKNDLKKPKKPGPLTQARYITGGVIGSIVGFGVGHAIVGEYSTMGWVFTMSQSLSLGVPILAAVVMAIIYWDGSANGTVDQLITTWGGFLWTGIALWAAFRIWEIVDLWVRPRSRLIRASDLKIKKDAIPTTPKASFAILPTVMPQGGVGVGFVGQW